MFSKFVTVLIASLSVVSTVSAEAESPEVSGVTLRGVTHGGTGCPQGTTDFSISVDAYTITARYTAFGASLTSGTYVRKNCQVNLDINYPANLQYAIVSTTFKDSATLDSGATARHSALYYFSGTTPQSSTEYNYVGPVDDDYSYKVTIPAASQIWSPCGKPLPLNINNAILLRSAGGADAYLQGRVVVSGLAWRRC